MCWWVLEEGVGNVIDGGVVGVCCYYISSMSVFSSILVMI